MSLFIRIYFLLQTSILFTQTKGCLKIWWNIRRNPVKVVVDVAIGSGAVESKDEWMEGSRRRSQGGVVWEDDLWMRGRHSIWVSSDIYTLFRYVSILRTR